MPSTRVLVCDNIGQQPLLDRLAENADLHLLQQVRAGGELIDSVCGDEDHPDVALIDNYMDWHPHRPTRQDVQYGLRAALEITTRCRQLRRDPPLMILWTARPDQDPRRHTTYTFLRFGGHLVLDKNRGTDTAEEVAAAIEAVVGGERTVLPEPTPPSSHDADRLLSERTAEILAALAAHMTDQEMADWFSRRGRGISKATSANEAFQSVRDMLLPPRRRGDHGDRRHATLESALEHGYHWIPIEELTWLDNCRARLDLELPPGPGECWTDPLPAGRVKRA